MASSCVYVARCTDPLGNVYIKVGKANNPAARAADLQTGCPLHIESMEYVRFKTQEMAYYVEHALHRELRAHKTRGEWFFAKAGDTKALTRFAVLPHEIICTLIEGPARTQTIHFKPTPARNKHWI